MEYNVITIAGNGPGYVDATVVKAKFQRPNGLAVSRDGTLYIADFGNNAIRTISPHGEVATLSGGRVMGVKQDGLAGLASFANPRGIKLDPDGNIYVADFGNNAIRQIDTHQLVSTVAGSGIKGYAEGQGNTVAFQEVRDLAYYAGYLFVVDRYMVRRVSRGGLVTTWAGSKESGLWDGAGAQARFGTLSSIASDQNGTMYMVDVDNNAIRYVTQTQKVGTLAGADIEPREGSNSMLHTPVGITVDFDGNCWVTDMGDYSIKQITPQGAIIQIAGSMQPGQKDGPAAEAQFQHPSGIAIGADGRIYVTDLATHSIRCLVPKPPTG